MTRLMCRFSIRDILWLTVVVALGISWWADHRKAIKARERGVNLGLLINLLKQEGYEVSIDSREIEIHHPRSGRIRYVRR